MRVTSTSAAAAMKQSLGATLERVNIVQEQLGTGRRINKPSDDPVGSTTALRYRSHESDQLAWQRSADDAVTWLGAADTALQSTSTTLRRAQDLAVLAGNGSLSDVARSAVKAELLSLRDELFDLANTQHGGQALFGGHSGSAVTRTGDTFSYGGDDGRIVRKVGSTVDVQVNVSAKTAFGLDGSGKDVFTVLTKLADAAGAGDQAAIAAQGTDLRAGFTRVLGALGTVGATTNRVEAARERSVAFVDQMRLERSNIEDLDLAEAILQLNSARNGYEAALGAVAKADLPSLANFLR